MGKQMLLEPEMLHLLTYQIFNYKILFGKRKELFKTLNFIFRYVNGQISSWIDCDSEDEQLASLSETEIIKVSTFLLKLEVTCYLEFDILPI